jgi:hypothetical protein
VKLGQVAARNETWAEARSLLVEASAIRRALHTAEPARVDFAIDLCNVLNDLSELATREGRTADAWSCRVEATGVRRSLCASTPDRPDLREDFARSLVRLADQALLEGRLDEARQFLDEAVTVWRGALDDAESRIGLSLCLEKLSTLALREERPAAAAAYAEEADRTRNARLDVVIEAAWREWERARTVHAHSENVPDESAPVLWFGPSADYSRSERRVLMLGVNPGALTFDGLPSLAALPAPQRRSPAACRAAYDAFPVSQRPYAPWFRSFNPFIEPLGAGWAPTAAPGRPLHVNLSPIATSRVFSSLDPAFAADLRTHGVALLRSLLDVFDPHVTVASLSMVHFDALRDALGVVPRTRFPVPETEAWICEWDAPGILVWTRKAMLAPISGTAAQRAAVGLWIREACDEVATSR